MLRRLLLATATVIVPAALIAVPGGVAAGAATRTCPGVIKIDRFAFNPPQVTPGQGSTSTVVATNCTRHSLQASAQWRATWLGPSGPSVPPGCPVIDPVALPANFTPHGTSSFPFGWTTFPSCTATGLQVTVTFQGSSGALAQATATLTIVQPAAGG